MDFRADLHSHTWYSDGLHAPAEVVAMAAGAGLSMLAVTDHETVAGIGEAIASGAEKDIEIVPGVEFSTRFKKVEVHVLGLWIDHESPALPETIELLTREREERAREMVARLNSLGVDITIEDVLKVTGKGTVARPHVARALADMGAAADYDQAFKKYIGAGRPAYVERKHMTVDRAADVIHAAGGIAVLAHGLIGGPQREHVMEMADLGLDAIEAWHPKLSPGQSEWLESFARQKGLGLSAGSDWHGEGVSVGDIGQCVVGGGEVQDLMARARTRAANARKGKSNT